MRRALRGRLANLCRVAEHGFIAERPQQPVDLAEGLLSLCAVLAPFHDVGGMRRALEVAGRLLHQLENPHLRVALDTMQCLADVAEDPTSIPVERGMACYRRALEVGTLWAAWLACGVVNTVALARQDGELGLTWSRRLIDLQDRLGAVAVLPQFETHADFLAMSGELEQSVRVFAASRQAALRTGDVWPRNPVTPSLLIRARDALSPERYDQVWSDGSSLTRAQLVDPA